MFSVPHLIILFVVALVVFGPEKLPELARDLGKVMAEFRRATGELRSTFEGHMRDLEVEAHQRRIGGESNAATPATAAPALPGPGTVAADAPRTVAPAPDEKLSASSSNQEESNQQAENTPAAASETHPEKMTDAGSQSA
jgi:sec-independent protein translocase protein TatB